MFHVEMAWKYGDVLVVILNQSTTVVTAVGWESRLSSGTAAKRRVQFMVTTATGQSRHHVVLRVVKVLNYGHGSAIILLENMVGTVAAWGWLKKIDCVR